MNTNREKTSSAMGFVVSVLLHAIFIAGCFALDAGSATSTAQPDQTMETNTAAGHQKADKPNS